MFRRTIALTMVVVFFAAFMLQGAAIMKCSCSGKVFIAGWQTSGCDAETHASASADEGCCCGEETEELESLCGIVCCILVGTLPDNVLIKVRAFQVPAVPIAEFVPIELPLPSFGSHPQISICGVRDPDPPGISLTVIYGSFLI